MVHQYKMGGYNIVIDVNSGAIHVVDDMTYDMIEMYESSDKDSIFAEMANATRIARMRSQKSGTRSQN